MFLLQRQDNHYEALVYNTIGQNLCPAEVFNGIDVVALAAQTGSESSGGTLGGTG